ncbi:MAG: D-alanyl-D-alanine carboxypeptidase/D-alanyl-D-alanine-endopeptidase [Vicingus serpentipes]|nr:D-alanyl-D-alanine carboxypeptidase/D-alanyl-D-alanine-endopeptidase [Vicingus serpentipes]
MRLLFITLFLFVTSLLSAQTDNDVRKAIQNLAADKDLINASISFYALDVDSNKIVAGLGANKSLVPASILKLVTTATAFEVLGAHHRFSTKIAYSGEIDSNRVLNGDIYIVGGGDPCLGAERYAKHYGNFLYRWATAIVQLGIDSINGRVIGDASIFNEQMIPSTWIWGDLGNYYGAGPSGLSIYENYCKIEMQSGKKGDAAQIVCVNPYIPDMEFDNDVKSMLTTKDESYIFGGPYQENRIIKGGIPLHKKDYVVKGSIPDPSYLAAFELDMELRSLGVKIAQTSSTLNKLESMKDVSKRDVLTTMSPLLKDIATQTNTYSINLYAEHLLNHIGIDKYKSGDTGSGAQSVMNFWKEKGVDLRGMYINDGSGLSRFNAITAKQMVGILKYMYTSKNSKYFMESLAVAGKSGTMRNVGKGTVAQGRIKAKSGYMTRVRSYSGYVTTKNNRNIAFALIVNNYNCTPYQMKKKMEKIMVKLAEINR